MEQAKNASDTFFLDITCEIVSAYVSNNPISQQDLPKLISDISNTVKEISTNQNDNFVNNKPAVSVKKSLTDESLICLNCGKPHKSLKRHLKASHALSPEEYRAHWGLDTNYPMVAPAYAARRSALAKDIGLGRKKGTKIKRKKAS